MSSIKVAVQGDEELMAKMKKLKSKWRSKLSNEFRFAGQEIRGRAILNINSGSRSGRVYKRTKAGKTHQASAPGEFPKTDSGALVAGIKVFENAPLDVDVGTKASTPHGLWLEHGTSKMDARPWLKPAFEQVRKNFAVRLKKAWRDTARGVFGG